MHLSSLLWVDIVQDCMSAIQAGMPSERWQACKFLSSDFCLSVVVSICQHLVSEIVIARKERILTTIRSFRIVATCRIRRVPALSGQQQAVSRPSAKSYLGYLCGRTWYTGATYCLWCHRTVDWSILLSLGHRLCQDSHPNYCI